MTKEDYEKSEKYARLLAGLMGQGVVSETQHVTLANGRTYKVEVSEVSKELDKARKKDGLEQRKMDKEIQRALSR